MHSWLVSHQTKLQLHAWQHSMGGKECGTTGEHKQQAS